MYQLDCYHLYMHVLSVAEKKRGGQSKSAAKRKAAIANLPVRDRTRTLGEYILRRKVTTKKEIAAAQESLVQLTVTEQDIFGKNFGLKPEHEDHGRWKHDIPWNGTNYKVNGYRNRTALRHILRKFRLIARWQLKKV